MWLDLLEPHHIECITLLWEGFRDVDSKPHPDSELMNQSCTYKELYRRGMLKHCP